MGEFFQLGRNEEPFSSSSRAATLAAVAVAISFSVTSLFLFNVLVKVTFLEHEGIASSIIYILFDSSLTAPAGSFSAAVFSSGFVRYCLQPHCFHWLGLIASCSYRFSAPFLLLSLFLQATPAPPEIANSGRIGNWFVGVEEKKARGISHRVLWQRRGTVPGVRVSGSDSSDSSVESESDLPSTESDAPKIMVKTFGEKKGFVSRDVRRGKSQTPYDAIRRRARLRKYA